MFLNPIIYKLFKI